MHADPQFELESPATPAPTRPVNRDPRMDPQLGDILRVARDEREVVDRVGDSVEYGLPNRAATHWMSLIKWQVWARLADVRKVTL